jgi:hypothetical protein
MNSTKMNILDAIAMSDYRKEDKDYITSLLYDNFLGNNKASFYFKTDTKIVVIRLILDITFRGQVKNLPVLIYLNKFFPNNAPEIFIEKIDTIAKSPQNLYTDDSLRIKTPKLTQWNKSVGLAAVISEINEYFNKNFPVYKLDLNQRGKVTYAPQTVLPIDKIIEFNFDSPEVNNSPINNYQYKPQSDKNISYKKEPLVGFSPEKIKQILIQEISGKIFAKVKYEYNTIHQHTAELLGLKNELLSKKETFESLTSRKEEIVNTFNVMTTHISDQIAGIKSSIDMVKDKEISCDNVASFINITNEKAIRIIAIEASIEEYLTFLKKAFERNVLTFQDTLRQTRVISRELFLVKYYRNKILLNLKL